MPLLCGGLLVDSPLVMCAVIWLTSRLVPLRAGALIAAFPSPLAPWQAAHFDLKSAAPSSADETEARIRNIAAKLTLHFICTLLTDLFTYAMTCTSWDSLFFDFGDSFGDSEGLQDLRLGLVCGKQFMATAAVLGDGLTICRQVCAIMTTEASWKVHMAHVVRVGGP